MRVALLVLVGLTARSAADPTFAPRDGILAAGVADKVLPIGGKPIVVVLEAGDGPKRELRYALAEGTRDQLNVTSAMEGQMTSATLSMPKTKRPAATVALGVTVAGRVGDEWKLVTSVDDASFPDFKGARDTLVVDNKGATHDEHVTPPPGAPPNVVKLYADAPPSLDTFIVALPPGPIGIGAQWAVLSRPKSAALDLLQRQVYTLTARDGNAFTVDVWISQLVATREFHAQQLTSVVKTFSSEAHGTLHGTTTSLAVSGELTYDLAMTSLRAGATVDDTLANHTTVTYSL